MVSFEGNPFKTSAYIYWPLYQLIESFGFAIGPCSDFLWNTLGAGNLLNCNLSELLLAFLSLLETVELELAGKRGS